MKIDQNELMQENIALEKEGKPKEALAKRDEFLQQMRDSKKDHCSCTAACSLHGNCKECVAVHRGHQDHLPSCFFPIINRQVRALSALTEDTAFE